MVPMVGIFDTADNEAWSQQHPIADIPEHNAHVLAALSLNGKTPHQNDHLRSG